MDPLKTILGTDIPLDTRGIVYLCQYDSYIPKLTVVKEILCKTTWEAIELYSNIPNPESQVVMGKTFDELILELNKLHANINNPKWVEELADYL
jgi:hypothetical protein